MCFWFPRILHYFQNCRVLPHPPKCCIFITNSSHHMLCRPDPAIRSSTSFIDFLGTNPFIWECISLVPSFWCEQKCYIRKYLPIRKTPGHQPRKPDTRDISDSSSARICWMCLCNGSKEGTTQGSTGLERISSSTESHWDHGVCLCLIMVPAPHWWSPSHQLLKVTGALPRWVCALMILAVRASSQLLPCPD